MMTARTSPPEKIRKVVKRRRERECAA